MISDSFMKELKIISHNENYILQKNTSVTDLGTSTQTLFKWNNNSSAYVYVGQALVPG